MKEKTFPRCGRKTAATKKTDNNVRKRRRAVDRKGIGPGSIVMLPNEKHGRTVSRITDDCRIELVGEGAKLFCPLGFV